MSGDSVQMAGEHAGDSQRGRSAENKANGHRDQSLPHDESHDLPRRTPESHPHRDFADPPPHRIADDAENADAGERKTDRREDRQQCGDDTCPGH